MGTEKQQRLRKHHGSTGREHDANHGKPDEGGDGPGVAFEVAGEPAVASDPGEGPFDDPPFGGGHDETMQLVAFDYFEFPGTGLGDRCGYFRSRALANSTPNERNLSNKPF